jgi:hypothetical protein
MLVVAALVAGITAATGGIVFAVVGSPITGIPVAASDQASTASTKAPAAPSVDDQALQSAKAAQQGAADAQKDTSAVGHGGNLLADPRAAGLVASNLGVSTSAATRALAALIPLSNQMGGLDPNSSGFAVVAADLGVSAPRLADAITALKLEMR